MIFSFILLVVNNFFVAYILKPFNNKLSYIFKSNSEIYPILVLLPNIEKTIKAIIQITQTEIYTFIKIFQIIIFSYNFIIKTKI